MKPLKGVASIIIKIASLMGLLHKLCVCLALFAQQFVTPGQGMGRA
jgi:hypothetical protein